MEKLRKQLEQLEKERKVCKVIFNLCIIVGLICFISIFVLFFKLEGDTRILAGIPLVLCGLFLVVGGNVISRFSKKLDKTGVIKKAIKKTLKNELPEAKRVDEDLNEEELNDTKLFNKFNVCKQTNNFIGEYNGVKYQFADLDLVERYNENGRTHTRTVFSGLVYILDYEKDKKGDMLLYGQKPYFVLLNDYKKVQTESGEFNAMFEIYADDPHQAFYFLTPIIIENLVELAKNYDGKINIAYKDGKVIVAITTDSKGAYTGEVIMNGKRYSQGLLSQSLLKRFDGYTFRYSCVHKLVDLLKLSSEKYSNKN